jgi:tetratricopeptide (TPR) repeat protein
MSGNEIKAKKLREMQPEMMRLTNQLMMTNMKTMVFTMVVAILIWRWLYSYLDTLSLSSVSLPWEPQWPMTQTIENFCPFPFPYWIVIYFFISVPIGQVLVSLFKVIEFSKDARQAEAATEGNIREKITTLETKIRSAKQDGINTTTVDARVKRIKDSLEAGEFSAAERQLEEADEAIENSLASRKRTVEMIETTRGMITAAKARGVNVSSIEPTLAASEAALRANDHTKAIYNAKQCQQKLKAIKDKHTEAEEALKSLREAVGSTPGDVQKLMAEQVKAAETAMESRSYDEVIDKVKRIKGDTDSTQRSYEKASEQLSKARELLDGLVKLSIDIGKQEDKLRNAEDKYNLGDYDTALDLAGDVNEELSRLKKLYEEASESVSFAKLVVANAQNFGAEVSVAEQLVAEAEAALAAHDYSKALSKATNAKNMAEDAKKQIQRKQKRS